VILLLVLLFPGGMAGALSRLRAPLKREEGT
jgi:hypothetical protein